MSVAPKTPEFVLNFLDAQFDSPLPFYDPIVSIESNEVSHKFSRFVCIFTMIKHCWRLFSQVRRRLAEQIRKFYFDNNAINEQAIPKFFDLVSDFNFVWGIVQSARTLAQYSTGKTFYTL